MSETVGIVCACGFCFVLGFLLAFYYALSEIAKVLKKQTEEADNAIRRLVNKEN